MIQCHQIKSLLEGIKRFKEELSISNQQLLESRSPTSPTATFGTGKDSDFAKASPDRQELRNKLYQKIIDTSYQLRATIERLEENLDLGISIKKATEILGKENVLGAEAVKVAFDVKLDPKDIPRVPFSAVELEYAKMHHGNPMLMLVINQDKDSQPLTCARMEEIVDPKLNNDNKAPLFARASITVTADYFTKETPAILEKQKASWALVSLEPERQTVGKNFIQQLIWLKQYVIDWLHLRKLTPVKKKISYQEAIDGFDQSWNYNFRDKFVTTPQQEYFQLSGEDDMVLEAINRIANISKAAKKFSQLKLAQLFIPSFVEMAYVMALGRIVLGRSIFRAGNKRYWAINTRSRVDNSRFINAGLDAGIDRLRSGAVGIYGQFEDNGLIVFIR